MQLPKIGVSGEYRFQVSKNGKVVRDTGFFPNLITDNGLNLICNASGATSNNFNFYFDHNTPLGTCYVGSGNASPEVADTQLVSRIAATSNKESTTGTSSFARGYAELVIVYAFGTGSVVGNVSEVGIGPSATSLFSRALILNSNGDPTTITILADEILTVTYRLRLTIPQVDISQSIDVYNSGVQIPTNVTIRPFASETYPITSIAGQHSFAWGVKRAFGNGAYSVATSSNTDLVGATAQSLTSTALPANIGIDPYVNNSFKRTGYATFSTTQSNRDIAVWAYSFGPGCFQVKFDPPLQKTNQQALRLSFGYQVARA